MARPGWMNIANIILFALMGCAWVIFLAGVGAAQSSCKKILDDRRNIIDRRLLTEQVDMVAEMGRKLLAHGRQLLASNAETCSNQFSLIWWTVWFQFVCIGLGVAVSFSSSLFQRFGLTVTLFFAISTTILMGSAKTANDTIFSNKDVKNGNVEDYVAASRAGLAGCVMLMIFNFVYMVLATDSYGQLTPSLALPTGNGPAGKAADTQQQQQAAAPVPSGTPTYSPAASPLPMAVPVPMPGGAPPPAYPSHYSYGGQPVVTEPPEQSYASAQAHPSVSYPSGVPQQAHPAVSYSGAEGVTAQVSEVPPGQPAGPIKQW